MEKCDEVKEVVKQNEELRKECEQERQAHSILKKKCDEMKEVVKKYEELLKSSLAEAEERAKIALESSALLQHENSSLKDQVKTLQGSVEKLEGKLHETHRMCEEILDEWEREREGQDHSTDLSQFEDTKVSRAEAEKSAQNVLESSAQLEHENSNVMHQVNTLQVSVKALRGHLYDALH
ncbi:angiomotin-like 2a [Pangasianodon hypophthalmus]|uniref:angiomotin-like 2a n=1 Tax=Pangasianodon hypophthalmus TaxID=310915 RepID=UPI0023078C85|nr:angiomotin-like 2a [Pangasianodon hypophthalmus]